MWGSRYFTGFFWQAYYWEAGSNYSPYITNVVVNTQTRARIIGRAQT